MSHRMLAMLRWLARHDFTPALLRKANQITLRALVLRGLVNRAGITALGTQVLQDFQRMEFVSRKLDADVSPSLKTALALVRHRGR